MTRAGYHGLVRGNALAAAGAHQEAAGVWAAGVGDHARRDRAHLAAGVEAQEPAQFAVLAVQPPRERLPLAQACVLVPEPGVLLGQRRHATEIAADIARGPHRHGYRVENGGQQISDGALDPVENVDFGLGDH